VTLSGRLLVPAFLPLLVSCERLAPQEAEHVSQAYYAALQAKDPNRGCELLADSYRNSFETGPCETILTRLLAATEPIQDFSLTGFRVRESLVRGGSMTELTYRVAYGTSTETEVVTVSSESGKPGSYRITAVERVTQ
jgi:hypothetical protein